MLDAGRTLVYRGAIDDQYGINVALDAPKNQYLRDGVESALGGFRARVRATYAPGCLVSLPTVAMPDGRGASSVTYTKDIAWILAENCVSCHRPGGAGPFAYRVLGRLHQPLALRASGLVLMVRAGFCARCAAGHCARVWHGLKD